jgi:hypothetical protein
VRRFADSDANSNRDADANADANTYADPDSATNTGRAEQSDGECGFIQPNKFELV